MLLPATNRVRALAVLQRIQTRESEHHKFESQLYHLQAVAAVSSKELLRTSRLALMGKATPTSIGWYQCVGALGTHHGPALLTLPKHISLSSCLQGAGSASERHGWLYKLTEKFYCGLELPRTTSRAVSIVGKC